MAQMEKISIIFMKLRANVAITELEIRAITFWELYWNLSEIQQILYISNELCYHIL